MENKQSLIKKLSTKLHPAKICKKLAALTLAVGLTLGVTACTNNNGNNNPGTTPPGTQQGQYSQYSQLLQDVLESDYYNLLISQAKNNTSLYEKATFDPHPYGFLEDQGHNVSEIKNGNLECYTISYVLDAEPNNLYISTRVENPGEYFTCYLLKYQLSDKEMSDYKLTHDPNYTSSAYYIQSVFMNDAVSNVKTPTIVSQSKITKTAFNELQTDIGGLNSTKEMTGSKFNEIIFMNLQTKTFDVYAYAKHYETDDMYHYEKLAFIPCRASGENFKITNGVYSFPTYYGGYKFTNDFDKTNTLKAKLYMPQKVKLNHIMCSDLTKGEK